MSFLVRRKGKGDGKGSFRGGRGGKGYMNKFYGGGGGGGGSCGGSRKVLNRIWDDGDDFCVFIEFKRSFRLLCIFLYVIYVCVYMCVFWGVCGG